jgi:hypothetical protein
MKTEVSIFKFNNLLGLFIYLVSLLYSCKGAVIAVCGRAGDCCILEKVKRFCFYPEPSCSPSLIVEFLVEFVAKGVLIFLDVPGKGGFEKSVDEKC